MTSAFANHERLLRRAAVLMPETLVEVERALVTILGSGSADAMVDRDRKLRSCPHIQDAR
jgi:hypothetical protein